MSQSLATMVISEPVEWSQNEHEPYLTSGSGFINMASPDCMAYDMLHQVWYLRYGYIRYGTLGMVN